MKTSNRYDQTRSYLFILIILSILFHAESTAQELESDTPIKLLEITGIPKTKVVVVGTFHFDQEKLYDELSEENQKELARITNSLAAFRPTKVVIEKNPSQTGRYNSAYKKFIKGQLSIDSMRNEIFQLGFRMAAQMNHDSIYLFDNKPEFIGSLHDFSFEKMMAYAGEYDSEFNQTHIEKITKVYSQNEKLINSLSLYDNLKWRNSVEKERYNTYRMHMIEMRVGVNDTWMGPDWLGRWYQRNIRMMTHIMKFMKPEDRIIIFVGDNHKWILEQLMENTPEFEVVSSFDFF